MVIHLIIAKPVSPPPRLRYRLKSLCAACLAASALQISSLGSIRSCWIIIIRTHILYTTHSSDFTILKSRDSVLVLHELVCLGVTLVDRQLVLVDPAVGQLAAGVEVEGLHGTVTFLLRTGCIRLFRKGSFPARPGSRRRARWCPLRRRR